MACDRVEGSEEFILGKHLSLGQGIKERRFTCVGVAHHRNDRNGLCRTAATVDGTLLTYLFNLLFQFGDAAAYSASIDLQFRLTGTAYADCSTYSCCACATRT